MVCLEAEQVTGVVPVIAFARKLIHRHSQPLSAVEKASRYKRSRNTDLPAIGAILADLHGGGIAAIAK
jgi:hypothetical protein